MVRLALVTIAKMCQGVKGQKVSEEEYAITLNKLVEYEREVPGKMREYVDLCYEDNEVSRKLEKETEGRFKRTIEDFLERHIKLVVSGCTNSLESVNSILTKIVTNPNSSNELHNHNNIFKTLYAHLRNNPKLIPHAQSVIKQYV